MSEQVDLRTPAGLARARELMPHLFPAAETPCLVCKGTGQTDYSPYHDPPAACPICRGTGRVGTAAEVCLSETAAVPEKRWQWQVTNHAEAQGWLVYHTFDSRRSAAGFPDLVLVRERVIFAELKSRKGKLSKAQEGWLKALRGARAEVYLWLPKHWPQVTEALK